jgi:hypothetical protein
VKRLFLVGALIIAGCRGDVCGGGTCIDLRVESGDPGVTKVDQLDLRVLGAATFTGKTMSLGAPVPLPVTTDISIPSDRSGNVWVAVTGLVAGMAVGEGAHGVVLKQGGRQTLIVKLTSKPARRVFLLSPHDGAIGGQTAADKVCGQEAQAAGLGGSYVALLGYTNVVGPSMTVTLADGDRQIVLPDNSLVSSDSGFIAADHIAAISEMANKQPSTSDCVWTNFKSDGTALGADCSGWNSKQVGQRGNYGEPDHSNVN